MWNLLRHKQLSSVGLATIFVLLAHVGITVPLAHEVFRLRSITAPVKYRYHAQCCMELLEHRKSTKRLNLSMRAQDESELMLDCWAKSMVSSFLLHESNRVQEANRYAELAIATAKKMFLFDDEYQTCHYTTSSARTKYNKDRLVKSLQFNLSLSSTYLGKTSAMPLSTSHAISSSPTHRHILLHDTQSSQNEENVDKWLDVSIQAISFAGKILKLRTKLQTSSHDGLVNEALVLDTRFRQSYQSVPSVWCSRPDLTNILGALSPASATTMRCQIYSMLTLASTRCLLMGTFLSQDLPQIHQIALCSARETIDWLPHMWV